MSGWLEYVTTPEFWAGGVLLGSLGSIGTYFTTKAADKRKFAHDHDMRDRQEWREDLTEEQKEQRAEKRRQDESLIAAAEEFTQVTTEILISTIDMEGAFNTIRDFVNNLQGNDDPAADKKIAHGQRVAEAQNRIAGPHNKLKLTASPEVLDAATRVVSAVIAVARMTTEPFAVVAAQRTASDELNNFTNVIRKAIGKAEYTPDDAKKAFYEFIDVFQRQTDDFVEQARDDMRAKGFASTPWDNYQRKTTKVPPPVI